MSVLTLKINYKTYIELFQEVFSSVGEVRLGGT